ncbi:hypothetical protein [Ilumatobacter sp.]|uniref:hypothetical protein n=1 Tax=Ilumatobacter sp. TaxID=1967498 RepID=UPI003B51A7F8
MDADDRACDRTARSRRAVAPDHGTSLVEIIMSIFLFGFAVTAVIGGIRAVISTSSTSDHQAKVEAVLTSAADRLAATEYVPCPDIADGDYAHIAEAAVAAVDPDWDSSAVVIERIEFWDSASGSARDADGDPIEAEGSWSSTNSVTGDCGNEDINLTTSRTLQRLDIRVTSPDGSISRTLEVVKSPIVADPAPTP